MFDSDFWCRVLIDIDPKFTTHCLIRSSHIAGDIGDEEPDFMCTFDDVNNEAMEYSALGTISYNKTNM